MRIAGFPCTNLTQALILAIGVGQGTEIFHDL